MQNYLKKQKSKNNFSAVDMLCGYPFIQINNGRELVIEGNCRILEYTDSVLSALCKGKRITVNGRNLDVKLMDSTALVVCGVLMSVCFGE